MVNLKNLAFAATAFLVCTEAAPAPQTLNPRASTVVKNGYIVRLKSDTADYDSHVSWVDDVHKRNIAKRSDSGSIRGIERKFKGKTHHFNGYSGVFDDKTIDEIRKSADVDYVEEDRVWTANIIPGAKPKHDSRDLHTQSNAPWGLAAISHRKPGSSSYIYDTSAGDGTYAYVLDTGIRTSHDEFGGRAHAVWTAFKGYEDDTYGHGTHVAGTIGGKTYGVAKKTNLLSVKVFKGQHGTTSAIIEGASWAIDDIVSKGRESQSVINMSLGGDFSNAMNDVVDEGTNKGIAIAVAAGNEGVSASKVSPASASSAITVGAVDDKFDFWSSSNYGSHVDIQGPGVDVLSAGITSDSATEYMTGTSMATPHISGLLLTAISVDGVSGVSSLTSKILDDATSKAIGGDLKGSADLLGNNGNSKQ